MRFVFIIIFPIFIGFFSYQLLFDKRKDYFTNLEPAYYYGEIVDENNNKKDQIFFKKSANQVFSVIINPLSSEYSNTKNVIYYPKSKSLKVILDSSRALNFYPKGYKDFILYGILTDEKNSKFKWQISKVSRKELLQNIDQENLKNISLRVEYQNLVKELEQKENIHKNLLIETEQIENILTNPEKFKYLVDEKIYSLEKETQVYNQILDDLKLELKSLKAKKNQYSLVNTTAKLAKLNQEALKAEGELLIKLLKFPELEKIDNEYSDISLNLNQSDLISQEIAREKDLIFLLEYKLKQEELQ